VAGNPTQGGGFQVCGAGDPMAAMSAGDWRAFWQARGMRELQLLLRAAWDPMDDGSPGEYDSYALRVASLLGSRASRDAIAAELGRIRRDELALETDPAEDARAAAKITAWFEAAGA
jgi:hypothetical protein